MQSSILSHFNQSGVDMKLLRQFLQGNIEQARALLDVRSGVISRNQRIEEDLLIANAQLFLLLLSLQ